MGCYSASNLTFAIDLLSSVGAMKSPVDKLFWPLLGIGTVCPPYSLAAAVSATASAAFYVSACRCVVLSYAMLALASNYPWVILGSAVLFGATSIAPGTGFHGVGNPAF